ncbi:hypothetical protein BGW38_001486 [Lunasporangiospora selenospora]|uniref:Uncharacterized protein n=1 Tax=Lunasporangiospora selenospora TaxID=979761 RepID=A0A9P6FTC3_9FUNG|nr:hypothetical protein BGW38_001486 [Lunasporangiospora selenospora]
MPSNTSSSHPSESAPVPFRRSRWPGRLAILIGAGHQLVGLADKRTRQPLLDAIQDGYFDKFAPSFERLHSFWFFIGGINIILLGKFMNWYLFPEDYDKTLLQPAQDQQKQVQRRPRVQSDRSLPRSLGYWMIGICMVGITSLPRSGFYLFGIEGLALILSK